MLTDHLIGIAVRIIFGKYRIFSIDNHHLDIEGFAGGAVVDPLQRNGRSVDVNIVVQFRLIDEDDVAVEGGLVHQVIVGIEVVIAASAHLLLHGLQVVKGGSFRIELGIHWKSLHKHADRVRKSHVFSSVIDGVEDRFLLAGGLGEQQGVCGCH